MAGPLIGVTGGRTTLVHLPGIPAGLIHLTMDVVIGGYAEKVAATGGVPVHVLPEVPAADALAHLDGVIISGGGDVDPRRYGAAPGPHATALDPARDEFEIALVLGALAAGIPLLGICRGCQVLNVALGGTLIQHLPPDSGQAHSFDKYPPGHRSHLVRFEPGSRLAGMYGNRLQVNSFHHQAVDRPGDGVTVVARAEDDVVEGIEVAGAEAIGVQWHPEMLTDPGPVFRWLVDSARD